MTEQDGVRTATFAGGFVFARRLREPGFRAALRAAGWASGQHVVMASHDETVADVVERAGPCGGGDQVLIALVSDAGISVVPAGTAVLAAGGMVGALPAVRIAGQSG